MELTERHLKAAELRECQGLTFQKIGGILGVSQPEAALLYREVLRSRREERKKEFFRQENSRVVSVEFSLGELAVLQRMLAHYQTWMRKTISPTLDWVRGIVGGYRLHRGRKIDPAPFGRRVQKPEHLPGGYPFIDRSPRKGQAPLGSGR